MKLATLSEKTFSVIEIGDGVLEIGGAAGLDIAGRGEITFLANPKYTPQIKDTRASAIFLNETERIERADIAVLRAKDPYLLIREPCVYSIPRRNSRRSFTFYLRFTKPLKSPRTFRLTLSFRLEKTALSRTA